MKKILNVAEKPSVAKKITSILAENNSRTIFSKSKYNPVYEFTQQFKEKDVLMRFTSVTGHVIGLAFEDKYSVKFWNTAPHEHLFKIAKVNKKIDEGKQDLVKNLQNQAKDTSTLILWLDCDREGEAIAFEVLNICKEVNPKMEVFRARFSALTEQDVIEAMGNLQEPDQNLADAVESRKEIDLRIGAAFTRYQTTLLKNKFPELRSTKVISYGPCQFPTLGFVVERWRKIENFVAEPFWLISCKHEKPNKSGTMETVDFQWEKTSLSNKEEAKKLFEKCSKKPTATVLSISNNQKHKYRPVPLSTVAMTKLATAKLKLSSHRVMDIAEKLYNRGFISYPRTETDFFSDRINLKSLIRVQKEHPVWGEFATHLLENRGFQWPRKGKHDDKAHPPIHPVKICTEESDLTLEEWRVYELVVRHFLACCSKDASGSETLIKIDINGENFNAKGLIIDEYNYLDVYPYEKWADNTLPHFDVGETFDPTELKLKESKTSPPILLTEQELIGQMDQNGIGTDATIHEHIKTIQDRQYAEKKGMTFKPTKLGIALVDAYEAAGTDLWKPALRASMEANMTEISKGNMKRETFLEKCLSEMEEIFTRMKNKEVDILKAVQKHFKGTGTSLEDSHYKAMINEDINHSESEEYNSISAGEGTCGSCGGNTIKLMKNSEGLNIAHCSVDNLKLRLPRNGDIAFKDAKCPICSFQVLEIKKDKNTKYTVCPWCYSNPPHSLFTELDETVKQMPCFKCPKTDCSLSPNSPAAQAASADKSVFPCPSCGNNNMTVRKSKAGKLFLGCKGYPSCHCTISIPDTIENIEVLSESCTNCGPNTKKVKIDFEGKDSTDSNNEESSVFCLAGCDKELESLGYKVDFPGSSSRNKTNEGESIKEANGTKANIQGIYSSIQIDKDDHLQNITCSICKKKGHYATECPIRKKRSSSESSQNSGSDVDGEERSRNMSKKQFLAQIKCYKCNMFGHYANKCPGITNTEKVAEPEVPEPMKEETSEAKSEKKVCAICGHIGRHPKGSSCSAVIKHSKS